MYKQYEKQFEGHYQGRELTAVVSQHGGFSAPAARARCSCAPCWTMKGERLLTEVMRDAPRELTRRATRKTCEAGPYLVGGRRGRGLAAGAPGLRQPRIRASTTCWWTKRRTIPKRRSRCCRLYHPNAQCDAFGRPHAAHLPGHGRLRTRPTGATAFGVPEAKVLCPEPLLSLHVCPSPGCATPFCPEAERLKAFWPGRATCPR